MKWAKAVKVYNERHPDTRYRLPVKGSTAYSEVKHIMGGAAHEVAQLRRATQGMRPGVRRDAPAASAEVQRAADSTRYIQNAANRHYEHLRSHGRALGREPESESDDEIDSEAMEEYLANTLS